MRIDEIDISEYEIEHIPLANETPRQMLMQMYPGQEFESFMYDGRDFTWEEMREMGALSIINNLIDRSTWVGIRLRKK